MSLHFDEEEVRLAASLVRWIVDEIRRARNSEGPKMTDEELGRLEEALRARLLASAGADRERWRRVIRQMEKGDSDV
jgi:hypothetical protein